jgi:hypothetical protein
LPRHRRLIEQINKCLSVCRSCLSFLHPLPDPTYLPIHSVQPKPYIHTYIRTYVRIPYGTAPHRTTHQPVHTSRPALYLPLPPSLALRGKSCLIEPSPVVPSPAYIHTHHTSTLPQGLPAPSTTPTICLPIYLASCLLVGWPDVEIGAVGSPSPKAHRPIRREEAQLSPSTSRLVPSRPEGARERAGERGGLA